MRRSVVLIAWGLLAAGCTAPASPPASVPAAEVEASGQGCGVCIMENPGDVHPCEPICGKHEADQMGYWAGAVLH